MVRNYRKAPPKTREERFWEKVEKTDTCWNWTGALSKGHGRFATDNGRALAHRFAYQIGVGPIPDGMQLDHMCHNKACVNVEHLRLVTTKENTENFPPGPARGVSGVRGVVLTPVGRWYARVVHNGKSHNAGTYDNLDDAEAAVIAKRLELFTHNDVDKIEAQRRDAA